MISPLDDYMVHQTTEPVAVPSTSDRNYYDRYWFNGYDAHGEFVFEAGVAVYPNRKVMDAHFSVSIGGVQYSFHGSRRAPRDRREIRVGPFHLEITQAMRGLRLRLEPNETGVECDLTFSARSAPHLEPKNVMYDELRCIMNTSRFTQMGAWQGSFEADGVAREIRFATTHGTRDKSWGVRPVGEPEAGAPGLLTTEPGVYWAWAPIFWDGFCTQFGSFEDRDGNPTQLSAHRVPLYASEEAVPDHDDGIEEMARASHTVRWERGTRRAEGAEFELVARSGETYAFSLEPLNRFQMLALGYQHPEWGHGHWKGEEIIGGERWKLDDIDPLELKHIHVHQICRARMGDRVGIGTLETIALGRHDRSGLTGILDGFA
jgi:hypothetical protein